MAQMCMNMNEHRRIVFFLTIFLVFNMSGVYGAGIEIYPKNPTYWQYNGKPTMLLGGTDDDALFQWAGDMDLLCHQLDLLQSCGGNYVRCTMSSREPDSLVCPPRVQPYQRLSNGKFDLDKWNNEYWERLEVFLSECRKRDIIVQIEVWATHDLVHVRPNRAYSWPSHPLNPKNNINYGYAPKTVFPEKPKGQLNDAFYQTIPILKHDPIVFKYQQAFVNELLSHCLKYDNVLYCVDNELRPQHPYQWAHYWAEYMTNRAQMSGKTIYVSEMHRDFTTPRNKKLTRIERMVGGKFSAIFDYPEIHPFMELSETSTRYSEYDELWKNMETIREYTADSPRPMTHVKVYGGGDKSTFRERRPTIHRFCEFVCAGRSAVRFHRPVRGGENGMGLNSAAQACLKAVRKFCDSIKPWQCKPNLKLLLDRDENEAYLLANPGVAYGILMTGSYGDGVVRLNTSNHSGKYVLTWINLETGKQLKMETINASDEIRIKTPARGSKYGWLVTLIKN